MNTSELLDSLVDDLEPVKRYASARDNAALWLSIALLVVVAGMLLLQPFRSGFIDDLLSAPRFLLECFLGLFFIVSGVYAAFDLSIPNIRRKAFILALPLVSGVLFAGLLFVGLFDSPLQPSMAGKREHCLYEVLWYGSVLVSGFVMLLRRGLVLDNVKTAAFAVCSVAIIPAVLMHVACMYEPFHVLTLHFAPFAVVSLVAFPLVAKFIKKN